MPILPLVRFLPSGLTLAVTLVLGCTPEPAPGAAPGQPFAAGPMTAPSTSPSATPSPAATASPGGTQTTSVSFQTQVAPLLQARCAACHGSAALGGVSLFDGAGNARYADVKTRLTSILSAVTSGAMPRGGPRLTPSEVELLAGWSAAGAPNN